MRQAGEHRDAAADVVALLAPWERAPADQVVELPGIELRNALQERAHHACSQIVGPDIRERALDGTSHGGADDVDDDRRGPG